MFYYGQWKRRHIWILSACSVVLTWISQLPFLYFFRKVNNTCDLDPGFFPAFVLRYFIKFQAYVMFFAVPGILIVSMSVAFIYKQTKKRPTEGMKMWSQIYEGPKTLRFLTNQHDLSGLLLTDCTLTFS